MPRRHCDFYTSFEEFIGAKILVEAIRRAGPAPTPERILRTGNAGKP